MAATQRWCRPVRPVLPARRSWGAAARPAPTTASASPLLRSFTWFPPIPRSSPGTRVARVIRVTISRTSDRSGSRRGWICRRSALPQGCAVARPRTTRTRCGPCDWCDVAVGSDHGDPYVFPAGVAELEHVWIQAHHQGFEHPITEYQQAPRPSLVRAKRLERVRAPTARASGTSCRPQRPGSGRAQLRRARARCRRRLARHRPRRRRGRPVDRAVRPRPRPRAPPRRRRAVPLRPRHGRRRRRVVAAARRGDGLRPLGDVGRGRQGRLVRAAVPRLRRLAHPARPRAQRSRRSPGHRLGRLHARAARHRAHRQRQPAAGARRRHQPPGGRRRRRLRHLEPAARPACRRRTSWCRCWRCSRSSAS